MLKRQLGALFLVICLSLAALPIVLGSISNDQTSLKDIGTQKSAEREISKVSELTPAPKNPEFVKFQMNKVYNKKPAMNSQKSGLIPSPVDIYHLTSIPPVKIHLPAYYDLRTLSRISQVKEQGSIGTCWTVATYDALESYLEPEENWDFSENNLKSMLVAASSEGFDSNPNDGGDEIESTAYLARWSGPVAESDDPYSPYFMTSPLNLPVQKHV